MAPVENNFPPRGPKIVLGRRLLGATDDDEARVSLSGIHRCGGADRVIAGRLFIGGLQRSDMDIVPRELRRQRDVRVHAAGEGDRP